MNNFLNILNSHLLPSSLVIVSVIDSLTEFLASSDVQMVVRFPIASVIVLSTSLLISLDSSLWDLGGAAGPESVQMVLM